MVERGDFQAPLPVEGLDAPSQENKILEENGLHSKGHRAPCSGLGGRLGNRPAPAIRTHALTDGGANATPQRSSPQGRLRPLRAFFELYLSQILVDLPVLKNFCAVQPVLA